MSRFSADTRLGRTPVFAVLCGALLVPQAHADDHELSPTVITAIAPSSPLTVITNPKDPRQPVPASDGGDYLKTIPGFALVRNGGTKIGRASCRERV